MNKTQSEKDIPWLSIMTVLISILALTISFVTAYITQLKPFEMNVRINPDLAIQHKNNFGIYIQVDFWNQSPQSGLITKLAAVVNKATSPEDKYLLILSGFRVLDEDGLIYKASEETLPLFLEPWQRTSKTANFIYMVEEQDFPLSSGTYSAELLVWRSRIILPVKRKRV